MRASNGFWNTNCALAPERPAARRRQLRRFVPGDPDGPATSARSSRSSSRAVVVLPQPDSPSMPTASPARWRSSHPPRRARSGRAGRTSWPSAEPSISAWRERRQSGPYRADSLAARARSSASARAPAGARVAAAPCRRGWFGLAAGHRRRGNARRSGNPAAGQAADRRRALDRRQRRRARAQVGEGMVRPIV